MYKLDILKFNDVEQHAIFTYLSEEHTYSTWLTLLNDVDEALQDCMIDIDDFYDDDNDDNYASVLSKDYAFSCFYRTLMKKIIASSLTNEQKKWWAGIFFNHPCLEKNYFDGDIVEVFKDSIFDIVDQKYYFTMIRLHGDIITCVYPALYYWTFYYDAEMCAHDYQMGKLKRIDNAYQYYQFIMPEEWTFLLDAWTGFISSTEKHLHDIGVPAQHLPQQWHFDGGAIHHVPVMNSSQECELML